MRTSQNAGLIAKIGLVFAGAFTSFSGCAYNTPGIVQDLTPGEVTQKDTPYSMKEIVYGEGNRVFVRKLGENQKPAFKENYCQASLIPIKGSKQILDTSGRTVAVEGDNFVLASLGERTIEILGEEGEFKDYFKPEEGINTIRSRNIPFKFDTITMEIIEEGERRFKGFYKILAEREEADKLGLYLVSKKGARIVLSRGKENRTGIRGEVYQPTKTEIVEKLVKPKELPKKEQRKLAGRLLPEVPTPTPQPLPEVEEKPKEQAKKYLEDYVAGLIPPSPKAPKGYDELTKDTSAIDEIRKIIDEISKGNIVEAREAIAIKFADRGYQEQATERVFCEEMTAREGLLKQLGLEIKQK